MKQTTYRGRIITYDEAIQAVERFDKEFRPTFPPHQWVKYAIEYNGQKYPPKTILRLIRVAALREAGSEQTPTSKPWDSRL